MSLSYRIAPGIAMRPLARPTPAVPRCAAHLLSQRHSRNASSSWVARAGADNLRHRGKPDHTISQAQRAMNKDMMKTGNVPIFPITFVALPVSQWPRSPRDFLSYAFATAKGYVTGLLTVFQIKLQSQEKWTSRPLWKAKRGKIGPTAKAMYRDMLQAFAAGDRATIEDLCTPHFGSQMLAALERRPKNQRVMFEMEYKKPLFFPKLKSHLIGVFNPFDKHALREQAVVAVSSFQKMTREKVANGDVVERSSKVDNNKVEYVVLVRDVNGKTYESTQWKIWGTTTTTTLEQNRQQYASVIESQKKAAGWKT